MMELHTLMMITVLSKKSILLKLMVPLPMIQTPNPQMRMTEKELMSPLQMSLGNLKEITLTTNGSGTQIPKTYYYL